MRLPWRLVERRLPTNQFPVSSPGKSLRAGVVRVSALGLAARTQAKHAVNIGAKLAVYFSGYWLEHGIVEEPLPGRYRLTDRGLVLAGGLLASEAEERAA